MQNYHWFFFMIMGWLKDKPPLYTPVVTGDGDRCVVQGNGSNISVYRAILFSVQIFLPKIFSVLILGWNLWWATRYFICEHQSNTSSFTYCKICAWSLDFCFIRLRYVYISVKFKGPKYEKDSRRCAPLKIACSNQCSWLSGAGEVSVVFSM